MEEFEKIQKLLRLKAYEQPRDGFHEEFLAKFKERQRSELLRKSSVSLFTERVAMWWSGLGPMKWSLAPAACAAAVLLVVNLPQESDPVQTVAVPATPEIKSVTIPETTLPEMPGRFEPHALRVNQFDDPASLLPIGPLDHLTEFLPDEKSADQHRFPLIAPPLIPGSEDSRHSLRDSP